MPTKKKSNLTVGAWLRQATAQLQAADVPSARLDALVLLEDTLQRERSSLLAHPEQELSREQQRLLEAQVRRRCSHEPLAYIRQKIDFFGRSFLVDERVLVPRPESETMISLLKMLATPNTKRLADVGAGSGALGITAAYELPQLEAVHLFDIDADTLEIAKRNVENHHSVAECFLGDLLKTDHGPYDVVLANLPYVPDSHTINSAALKEPSQAIFGGPDGLNLYRRLFTQLSTKNWQPRLILTEALPFQHDELLEIAQMSGFALLETSDFIQAWEPY